jgi:hypothetical protein
MTHTRVVGGVFEMPPRDLSLFTPERLHATLIFDCPYISEEMCKALSMRGMPAFDGRNPPTDRECRASPPNRQL